METYTLTKRPASSLARFLLQFSALMKALGFLFGQFLRDSTHDTGIEAQLHKSGKNLLHVKLWLISFKIDDVVIPVDFVSKPRDGFQNVVKFQDDFQVADTGGVDFEFDHGAEWFREGGDT